LNEFSHLENSEEFFTSIYCSSDDHGHITGEETLDDSTSVNESQLLQDLNNYHSISESQYLQDLNNGYLEDTNDLSSMNGFQPSETLNNLNEHIEYVNDTTTISQLDSLHDITCQSEPLNITECEVEINSPGKYELSLYSK